MLTQEQKRTLDKAGAIFEARGDYYARGYIEDAKGELLEDATFDEDEVLAVLASAITIADSIRHYGAGDLCFELLNELRRDDED